MTEQKNLRLLHVVDREGGDTRLVAELDQRNFMIRLRVQQYAGFDFKDVTEVTVCAGDLCSLVDRYRAHLERKMQAPTVGPPVGPWTALEVETGPRPSDGSLAKALAKDAEKAKARHGNESDNVG